MPDIKQRIKLAFKRLDGDAPFHTIQEVAKAADLSYEDVRSTVLQSGDFVLSSRTSNTGEPLISTREDFREKASFSRKLFGAFANRID